MGNGNRKAQYKRRKERLKNRPPKQKEKFQLIDGNMTFYPIAECKPHNGYLTEGLIETHRCKQRKCPGLKPLNKEGE